MDNLHFASFKLQMNVPIMAALCPNFFRGSHVYQICVVPNHFEILTFEVEFSQSMAKYPLCVILSSPAHIAGPCSKGPNNKPVSTLTTLHSYSLYNREGTLAHFPLPQPILTPLHYHSRLTKVLNTHLPC
jgi:hypothetical protein